MSFTEVENINYGDKIKGGLSRIVGGIIIIIIACSLLWWNEGRAVKRTKALEEGAGKVISVDSSKIDNSNNDKLIHITGSVKTNEILKDSIFDVSVNSLALDRSIEVYQWEEDSETKEEKKIGGSTEKTTIYTYKKIWSNSLIDSTSFKELGHDNGTILTVTNYEIFAKNANIGAFKFSENFIKSLGNKKTITIDSKIDVKKVNPKAKIINNQIYIGNNPNTPEIGDVKVTFKEIPLQDASVIAQQQADSLVAYSSKTGSVLLISSGIQSSEMMFSAAKSSNNLLTWILRIVGVIVMVMGFNSLFSLIGAIGDIIPFLGDILSMGTSIISLILGLGLSSLIIVIAWIAYRPLLAISLLVIVGAVIFAIIQFKKKTSVA